MSFLRQAFFVACLTGLCCGHGFLEKRKDFEKFPDMMMDDEKLGICPTKNMKKSILMPHSTDCSKFYICDSGTPHLQICPNGLHFNSKVQTCDYPDRAECDIHSGISEKPKGKRIDDEDSDMCPKKNSKYPVLFPHPFECGKFFICDNGTPHLQNCLDGLHFNKRIEACDFPEQAGCVEDGGGISEKPKGKRIGDEDSDMCPKKNSKYPVLFPHPFECGKFFICDNGTPHLRNCQDGLHFNKKIGACDFPEQAGCIEDGGDFQIMEKPRGKVIKDNLGICPKGNFEFLVLIPHPTSCNNFFICDNGSPRLKTCQPGLHFNPKIKACDYPENSDCHESMKKVLAVMAGPGVLSSFCPPLDSNITVFHRSSSDCTVYYMCSHGFAYEFVCPSGLHFSLQKKQCDYENKANCSIADN